MANKRDSEASIRDEQVKTQLEERPRKKARVFTHEDAKLAAFFEKLASDDENVRLQSAAELIKYYSSLKSTNEEGQDSTTLSREEPREKIKSRLLRGLCSGRKNARIGFSLALTEVLRIKDGTKHPTASFHENLVRNYLQDIEVATRPALGASSQEKRDCLLGKVFAISSLIQSEVLLGENNDGQFLHDVFEYICSSIQQSEWPWLKEEFGLVCCQLVQSLGNSKINVAEAEDLLQILLNKDLAKTREGIAIWVRTQSHFSSMKPPQNIWYKNDPLSGKELGSLVKVLHGGKHDPDIQKSSGMRQERPHFVWMVIIQTLIDRDIKLRGLASEKSNNIVKTKDGLFKQFWTEAVDNMFFNPAASAEKKALGFQLFAEVVSSAPTAILAAAFSPKLMKCLINQSAQSHRYLHNAAKNLLHAMMSRAHARPDSAPVIFSSLVSGYGDFDFDSLTKSKTVFDLLANAEGEELKAMLNQCKDSMLCPSVDKETKAEAMRQKIADLLTTLIKQQEPFKMDTPNVFDEGGMVSMILSYFVVFGFLKSDLLSARYKQKIQFSSTTQEMFRSRLSSCLVHLASRTIDELLHLLSSIVLHSEIGDVHDLTTLSKASNKTESSILRARKILTMDLPKKQQEKSKITADHIGSKQWRAFKILLCLALLQAYSGEADAISMLDELHDCSTDLFSKNEGDQAKASGAVVEIILGFCSQQSALSRKVAEQVFKIFSPNVNKDSLQSMLDVLQQKESSTGQSALFGEVDIEAIDGRDNLSDSDGSDVEHSSDVEDTDNEAESATNEDDEDSEDSAQSDSASSDASISSELAEFESKLAGALKISRSATARDDEDIETMSSSSGSIMDDEQMLALDSTISDMFRQRRSTNRGGNSTTNESNNSRQANRAAKESVVAFKNRVLSLLTTYLKQQHANSLSLSTILPLLELIHSTRNSQVSARASALLLDTYFPIAKKRGLPLEVDIKEVLQLLEEVHEETRKWYSREHVKCGSKSCLFLARVALAIADKGGVTEGEGNGKARRSIAKKIGKLYDGTRGDKELPDWQILLWKDWEEFRRQVVEMKRTKAQ